MTKEVYDEMFGDRQKCKEELQATYIQKSETDKSPHIINSIYYFSTTTATHE